LISGIHIFTSNNVFMDIKNDISTSKKSILDINNSFWMAAYGDISLVKIQLQLQIQLQLIVFVFSLVKKQIQL